MEMVVMTAIVVIDKLIGIVTANNNSTSCEVTEGREDGGGIFRLFKQFTE